MSDALNQFIDHLRGLDCEPANHALTDQSVLVQKAKDKRGVKRMYASFKEDERGAFGTWYDCEHGEGGYWHPAGSKDQPLTDGQRKAIDDARAANEQRIAAERKAASDEATRRWNEAAPAKAHPYLTAKGIKANGARIEGDNLLIAAREGKTTHSLQTISPDGDKRFMFGGRKRGCYYVIGTGLDKLVICEGFATGASIHEATGLMVAVAFDAGNLLPVSKYLRGQLPNAVMLIAADNDKWGKDGENPGVKAAQQAGLAVGAQVVWPEFGQEQEGEPTDWNDYAKAYGAAAVKDEFDKAMAVRPVDTEAAPEWVKEFAPIEVHEAAYKEGAIEVWNPNPVKWAAAALDQWSGVDEKGKPRWYDLVQWKKSPSDTGAGGIPEKDSGRNAKVFIERVYGGLFRLNNFSDEIFVMRCPPWESEETFRARAIEDTDVFNMSSTLETHGLGFSMQRTKPAIEAVARDSQFHPVREYFDALKWDGKHRLATWLRDYCGATQQNSLYLSTIGTMWMVAGVRRIYEPGTKFDHMLVLEGATNIGKSTVFRILSTFGKDVEESFFCESVKMDDIDKPAALTVLQGKLIVEFPELDGMDRATDTALKRWITKQVDELVKKYSNYRTKYPRQFILAGTTNETAWLRDATGNRRYWPVKSMFADTAGLKQAREQLWAEAVHLHKEGYKIYLKDDDPVYGLAAKEQADRMATDSWEERICSAIDGKRYISNDDIVKELGFNLQNVSNADLKKIGVTMRKLKWEYEQAYKFTKHKKRVWVNPDHQQHVIELEPQQEEEIAW